MARKIECDRCGKQWTPETHDQYDQYDDEKPVELSVASFDIPWAQDVPPSIAKKGWVKRPGIAAHLELCQDCARAIYKFATVFPEGVDSEPANPEANPQASAG